MKLIKCDVLYDGTYEKKDCFIGFEEDKIKYVIEGGGRPPKGKVKERLRVIQVVCLFVCY